MNDFKIDKAALRKLLEQKVTEIKKIDAEIRKKYAGQPANVVAPAAKRAFAKVGLDLKGSLHTYAESVEKKQEFNIKLG